MTFTTPTTEGRGNAASRLAVTLEPILWNLIDLHSHILPGIDDGARTIEDSREIGRRAAAEGITAIAATPHVRWDWPTTADTVERGVAALRRDFVASGIAVNVLHGAEIALDRLPDLRADDLVRFSLAQKGRHVLLECPYGSWPLGVERTIQELRDSGLTPLLAHPERNIDVQQYPDAVIALVAAGALVQVTAASLDGRLGRRTKATTKRLLALRLVHVLASDAHTPDVREIGLAAAAAETGDPALARYLTEDAPAAIVAGEAPREPPTRRPRGRFRLGLGARS